MANIKEELFEVVRVLNEAISKRFRILVNLNDLCDSLAKAKPLEKPEVATKAS